MGDVWLSLATRIFPFFLSSKSNSLHTITNTLTMSIENETNNAAESQFQKPSDLVEKNEDTGVMQLESLCMNCHENVRFARPFLILWETKT